MALNLPNQITVARLILSIGVFALIPCQLYRAALIGFVIAAGTDWLDGYLARKYQLITQLGRILDPFADKILICGTFTLLGAAPGSQLPAWMAVIVIGRELLVTALRSFLEQQGADFSANMPGKLKMVFQCAAVAMSLYGLEPFVVPLPAWWPTATHAMAWLAVLATIYSGAIYVVSAARLLRQPDPAPRAGR